MKQSKWLMILVSLGVMSAQAQEKLDFQFTGRALFDGATYWQNGASMQRDGELHAGVALPDIRFGIKGSYGDWIFRSDIAYTNNTVLLKDVFLQYQFSKRNSLRLGHFFTPFGTASAYGTPKKEYMEDAEANVFVPGRRIGIAHTIYNEPLYAEYGVFADKNALTKSSDKSGRQGYTLSGRFIWRPLMTKDYGFHVGVSGMHVKAESTENGKPAAVSYSKRYLTYVNRTPATQIKITDAKWENKATVEMVGLYHNYQLSGQYYWSHVAREKDLSYNTKGFYLAARGILLHPANYTYKANTATVSHPTTGNLELLLGYGFLDLRDTEAHAKNEAALAAGMGGLDLTQAGRMSDYSVGLSYFLNKYVTFRLNYHHIKVENFGLSPKRVNVLQLRAHYVF